MNPLSTATDWIAAGTTASVDSLVLRFAVVMNGLHDEVNMSGGSWFIADVGGRVIDCGTPTGAPVLGASVTQLCGGLAADELSAAWKQVLMGRAQTVWPWHGGRARATMRSIELHPLRDILGDEPVVIGALVVMVDAPLGVPASRIAA